MRSRGVVTFCDGHYFAGLLAMHASIQTSSPCPVACYVTDLSAHQRQAAEGVENLVLLDLPADPRLGELERATRDS